MQFADYNAFRQAVLTLIEGDDIGTPSFSLNTADLMIGMGENRAYRDLRASTMVTTLSVAVSSNAAALPSDLIELKELYFSGERPLEIVDLDRMRRYIADGYGGLPTRFAALNGDSLTFWPTASGTVLGSYYARPTALKDITWANATTLARYPEVFIYACLVESVPFLGQDSRLQLWEHKYADALMNAQREESQRAYGGSPLRMRPR
jgi:hypothetical protein